MKRARLAKKEESEKFERKIAALIVILIFLEIVLCFFRFSDKLVGDEEYLWNTVKSFSKQNFILPWAFLEKFPGPMTPLYFIIFGWIEKLFNLGVVGIRAINSVLAIIILLLIWKDSKSPKNFIFVSLILIIAPYFISLSISAYTDILFFILTLCGFILYKKEKYWWSAIFFTLSIATRQFGVIIPLALAVDSFFSKNSKKIKWISPAIAASSLILWFILFGFSFTPPALKISGLYFNPYSGIYFLTTIFAQFIILEIVLFGNYKDLKIYNYQSLIIFILSLALFLIFPVPDLYWVDKFSILFFISINLPPLLSAILYSIFASLAVIRFKENRFIILLFILNMIILTTLRVGWDKYTLIVTLLLCYMKSSGLLDNKKTMVKNINN